MSAHHHRRAWGRRRLEALERDGWRCQRCGEPGRLEVHHRRKVADGGTDDLDNLVTLCRGCHLRAHRRVLSPRQAATLRAWDRLIRGSR